MNSGASWMDVVALEDLDPDTGACVLLGATQVALVRAGDAVYAIDNHDPFSGAYVVSRGIVGDAGGVHKISSPMYKHAFDLRTGVCLDDPSVRLSTWPVRVRGGRVEVLFGAAVAPRAAA